ncbi:RNA-binding domain-containing protein [Adhaeribacter radiodurans]|uniref:ATP-binding protein n=1 Tax=Adhaeribacter radiodurans TaxID=2745197 RepID=A0A7L7L6Q5_9BACT|nr:ATP-binding protein [Adhaeribacter radiodurans]QMU28463.1 ATP-binding protein [Adhaeribacter radiodurans]
MHDLLRLIAIGENEQLDFKKTITHPDKIARTLVSFANTQGGILLVGVQDNGTIVGVDPEEEKHTLELAAQFYCDPPLTLDYKEIEYEKRLVLEVIVPESSLKPHLAKVKENDWRGYVRVKDESVQSSKMVNKALRSETALTEATRPLNLDKPDYQVLEYLKTNRRITLAQFMKLANISQRRAYRILVKLVLHGYLRLHDKEKEDYYTLS